MYFYFLVNSNFIRFKTYSAKYKINIVRQAYKTENSNFYVVTAGAFFKHFGP